MLNILKNFFENEESAKDTSNDNLKLLSGLMIEAANSDGKIDNKEIQKIHFILINTFEEDPVEVKKCIDEALDNKDNNKSLFYYTSKINIEYSEDRKLVLIETLWEIILSDGDVHDYESSLVRRLSGLLYISDVSSGNARKRALNKISKKT